MGFETLTPSNLKEHAKLQNLNSDYSECIKKLHGLGIMINGSFVFGMDGDGPEVFERTVEWAVEQGIETATFHIMTPYPDTALYKRMQLEGRLKHDNWDLYDTRHVVYRPRGMSEEQLEQGYWRAYKDFYRWSNVFRGASSKPSLARKLRHAAYAGGWKKFEPLWDAVIRAKRTNRVLPLLEATLSCCGLLAPSPSRP